MEIVFDVGSRIAAKLHSAKSPRVFSSRLEIGESIFPPIADRLRREYVANFYVNELLGREQGYRLESFDRDRESARIFTNRTHLPVTNLFQRNLVANVFSGERESRIFLLRVSRTSLVTNPLAIKRELLRVVLSTFANRYESLLPSRRRVTTDEGNLFVGYVVATNLDVEPRKRSIPRLRSSSPSPVILGISANIVARRFASRRDDRGRDWRKSCRSSTRRFRVGTRL